MPKITKLSPTTFHVSNTTRDVWGVDDDHECPDCGQPLDLDHQGCRGVIHDDQNGGWKRLPKPTNKQSSMLLRRMCNRLALVQPQIARTQHSCIFCGQPIRVGDVYRNGSGCASQAHDLCYRAVAKIC